MLTLGFDTSAAHCAVALLLDETVVAERFEPMAKGQAESLMGLCEDTLRDANKTWSDLDLIGVGIGPGNFTGIRISVSAARGLALSLGIKAVGVSSTQAQAYGIKGVTISSLDARQDKLYVDVIGTGESRQIALCEMGDLPNIPARAEPTCIGHRANEIAARVVGFVAEPMYPIANAIALIAASRAHLAHDRPAPHYVRAPDAAPPRDTAPKIIDA
jgi:tRNA threonylcarbamoyl adenosine modification protein YeaZ